MAGARALNKLTDSAVRKAHPSETLNKLSDGGGLQLWVMPNGSKLWRVAYRFNGKQKLLSLGPYPVLGLAEAREQRDQARRLLVNGVDPSDAKRAKKVEDLAKEVTFRSVSEEYVAKLEREGRAPITLKKVRWLLDLAMGDLGRRRISEITPADVLIPLRRVEARGNYETARRMRSTISAVFRYAVATARADSDPAQPLQGALTAPKVTHRAALLNPVDLGGVLRAMDGYSGQGATRIALQLMVYLFPRPGELRQAEWDEFDLDERLWTIPAARAKMRREHRKPLPRQAVTLLEDLQESTGFGPLLFPSIRSSRRPMSENTLNGALRRLGYQPDEVTAHGFRATASTLLNESNRWSPDAIERELGHLEANDVRRAYTRGMHMDERREMIQWWADYCDRLRDGGAVVRFSRG